MKKTVGLMLMGIIAILAWGYMETFRVVVTRVDLAGTPLSRMLAGKTVAQLTDIHFRDDDPREKMMLDLLDQIKPDILVLTGDFITWNGDASLAIDFLSKLNAKDGVYAVLGDYDRSDSRQSCLFCHEPGTGKPTRAHDVRMLRNEAVSVNVGGKELTIVGLDEQDDAYYEMVAHVPKGCLVLNHSPLGFDDLDGGLGVLMLAGDTHGGQIPLPSWVWHVIGYEKNARYNDGLFQKGRDTLYVNHGIGTSHVQIRLFCPPEIVVFQF